MTTTPNLGLSTYDTSSGSTTTFLTFRLALAGNSSNMTLLDNFAGNITGSLISLQANSVFVVQASVVTSNVYEATVSGIFSYVTDSMISLQLNASNTASVTLNINSLGAKTLKKENAIGELVDLESGDLKENRWSLFFFDGTYYVLMGATTADQVSINGTENNFLSVSASGTIQDSGTSASSVLLEISGSSVMSGTTGSEVRHNSSGITTGSYNAIEVDIFGHVTGGSVLETAHLSAISGSAVMSNTTGSEVRHNPSGVTPGIYLATDLTVDAYGHVTLAANGTTASSVGAAVDNPFLVTGSSTDLTNMSVITAGSNIEITTTGSVTLVHSTGGATGLGDMSLQSASAVNITGGVITPLSDHTSLSGSDVHGLGDISLQSASAVNLTGTLTGALSSIYGTGIMSDTTGSEVKHNASSATEGSYTAANITIDSFGHVTVAGNGVSASSVGAAVDNPFLVTGSSTDLTNMSVITAGSNIEITTTGSVTLVHSTGGATGLGDMSLQSASAVNITGGVITPLSNHTSLSGSDVHGLGDISGLSIGGIFVTSGSELSLQRGGALSVSGSELSLNQTGITTGSYNAIDVNIYGQVTGGSVISIGDTVVVFVLLNQSTALAGTDTSYIRVPSKINGYNLIEVAASCSGSSTSGSPVFLVKKGTTSMLTANIQIDEGEYDSSTSSASAVIDTANDNVATSDQIWISTTASLCGTAVTYAGVELTFRLP